MHNFLQAIQSVIHSPFIVLLLILALAGIIVAAWYDHSRD